MPHFYGVDLGVEDLLVRAGRTVVGGCEMPCLSPEDSLLVLCLHAAKHLWMRLIWLVDIAETLRTQTIDYSLVFSQARALGIARILGISFWLVKNVLRAGASQTRGGNDCGRFSSSRSRQRIRRASCSRRVL